MTKKSKNDKFINRIAWLFLVLSSFSALGGILKIITINFASPFNEMQRIWQAPSILGQLPEFSRFFINNMQVIMIIFLLSSVLMVISSIGVLRRKNWARVIFIILLVIVIIQSIGGLLLQSYLLTKMPFSSYGIHLPNFKSVVTTIRAVSIFFGVIVTVFLGNIIRRFMSTEIKSKFLTEESLKTEET
ncbi:MAG: hypothetical protein ACQEQC_07395 [Elusimicrobiota bacterium]